MLLTAKESPKWLAANGKQQQAEDALHALRGRNLSEAEIAEALSDDHGGSGK